MAYSGAIDAKWEAAHGWLICDGRKLDGDKRSEYYTLAQALNKAWGSETAEAFFLPDLRGLFLRGVMSPGESAVPAGRGDSEAGTRKHSREDLGGPSQQKGNSGNSIGSYQDEQVKSHTHDIKTTGISYQGPANNAAPVPVNNGTYQTPHTESYGGAETRPTNAYVYWIIRYK